MSQRCENRGAGQLEETIECEHCEDMKSKIFELQSTIQSHENAFGELNVDKTVRQHDPPPSSTPLLSPQGTPPQLLSPPPLEPNPPSTSLLSPQGTSTPLKDALEEIECLRKEIVRMKPLYDAGKSVRVRQIEHLRKIHPNAKNWRLIDEGDIAAHGGKPVADAVAVIEIEKDQGLENKEANDHTSAGYVYWERYGAKAELVYEMKDHARFVQMLEWRGSLVPNLGGEANYKSSKFHKMFNDAIKHSPLKTHSETYECTEAIDIAVLRNYFNYEAAAKDAYENMQTEFRIQDNAAKKKREENRLLRENKRDEEEERRRRHENHSRISQGMRHTDQRAARDERGPSAKKRKVSNNYDSRDSYPRDHFPRSQYPWHFGTSDERPLDYN